MFNVRGVARDERQRVSQRSSGHQAIDNWQRTNCCNATELVGDRASDRKNSVAVVDLDFLQPLLQRHSLRRIFTPNLLNPFSSLTQR